MARTVSSSAISGGGGRGGALAVQPQANLVNVERNLEVQTAQNIKQTQEISALRSTVDALRAETTTLNKGLVSITNLIQQDSAVEKRQEAEAEWSFVLSFRVVRPRPKRNVRRAHAQNYQTKVGR
jgi:hypothetical protein